MSAKIIAVFNQKGGCGKSQATMQIGGAMALLGLKVWVVDMDKQGTSIIWSTNASADLPFPAEVVNLAPLKENFIGEVKKRFDQVDVIFIDCPPAIDSSIPWAALNIADVGLIPVSPVLDNIWAAKEARELFVRARQNRPELQAYYLSSIVSRGRVFEQCKTLISNDPDVPMLKSQLSRRNAFPESQVFGSVVGLLDPKSAASEEVNLLTAEIMHILGLKIAKKRSKRSKERTS